MADSEVLKKLKDIPFKIQTASLKGRREVVEEIRNVLSTPGITEPAVRFVCRLLVLTLHRYRDSTSQSYVKGLVAHLAATHREWTLKALLPVLLEVSEQLKNTASSKSICQSGLYALRWSTVLVDGTLKSTEENGVDYNALVLSQANLLAAISAYGDHRKNDKAFSMLHTSWVSIGKEKLSKWLEVLLAIPPDSGPHICVTFSTLCRHYQQIGDGSTIEQHKTKMLESFTKSVISVKARPNANYIKGCHDLLQQLGPGEVRDALLPALHKAMLRSPETIVQAVGEVFASLNVELDGLAVDIGKSLIVNLHSKDEWVRGEALTALERLAARCSQVTAARALLTHAFAEYNGASGKLTSSEDKIAVLLGVLTLRALPQRGADRLALFNEAATQLSRVLDSESHERTLCVALDTLQKWTIGLDSPMPDIILEIFKKNLSAKSTTQNVRTSYVSMVAACVRGVGPGAALQAALLPVLQPVLLKAVEKATQQPLQHLVVSEGICAMLGLALLDGSRELPGKGSAWAALTHPDKHVLLHDRVLTSASDDVLIQVVLLCRTVLENYQSVASEQNSPVYRAFILVLLSPIKAVRTTAIEEVKALLAKEDRVLLARHLALKLNEVLEEGKVFSGKEKSPTDEKGGGEVTGKMILDSIHALCSFRGYPEKDSQELAIAILPSCHHPLAAAVSSRAWVKLLGYLRHDPKKLVGLYSNNLKNKYIAGYSPSETLSNVVATLVATNPELLAGSAVQCALATLQEPELLRVTRDEYFTYLMPEGDLYDKSSVPGNEDSKEMNLKRESKAYSYKDQLEELQLRRELEEKNKRQGKVKEVPLSAKQKEAIKVQLAKESAIRQRLSALNLRVVIAVRLLEAVQRGSAPALCRGARRIVSAVLGALRSPLAAPRLADAYGHLRFALLPNHLALGDILARLTLRLHKPQCDLEPSWEDDELDSATARTINLMYMITCSKAAGDDDEDTVHKANHFTAPGFCYAFPLLKLGLSSSALRADEQTMLNGLSVIETHAALRVDTDMMHPALFPIDHMFRLLIDLISKCTAACQHTRYVPRLGSRVALSVIETHAALRVDTDMMHPALFPIDHMFRLLIDLISKCTAACQHTRYVPRLGSRVALSVIETHAALRVDTDMMHPALFPIDHMFRLLIDLISKCTAACQHTRYVPRLGSRVALSVIETHAALRVDTDMMHPALFPIDHMFRLLIDLISKCTAACQHTRYVPRLGSRVALSVIETHAALRVDTDMMHPALFPIDHMFRLLIDLISKCTAACQHTRYVPRLGSRVALSVIETHAALRVDTDMMHPALFPIDHMFRLLIDLISKCTAACQHTRYVPRLGSRVALSVIETHAALRVDTDMMHPALFPIDHMFRLLIDLISKCTAACQHTRYVPRLGSRVALSVIETHAALRVDTDMMHPALFPIDHMFRLLIDLISKCTAACQHTRYVPRLGSRVALSVIETHAALRVDTDMMHPALFPIDHMFRLLIDLISKCTAACQHTRYVPRLGSRVALSVIETHAALRVDTDMMHPALFPIDHMFRLLIDLISKCTAACQHTRYVPRLGSRVALSVIETHAALRVDTDMMHPALFPIDHMFRLLIDLISKCTAACQHTRYVPRLGSRVALSVIETHAALRVDTDMMHPALFPIDHMFRLLIDLISKCTAACQHTRYVPRLGSRVALSVIETHAALRVDTDMMHPALFPIDHMFRLLIDLISKCTAACQHTRYVPRLGSRVALSVIETHAALRVDTDMMHPALFPIDHMFRLLIDLISSTSGRVQAACTVSLLETAQCVARATLSLDDVTCLLAGLQNPMEVVRDAALRALLCVVECLPPLLEDPEYALTLTKRLLVATFDISEDNKKLAIELWSQLPLAAQWSREPALVQLLLQEAQHPAEPVQRAAAAALAHLVERSADPEAAEHVLEMLQDIYSQKLPMIPAKLDQFGHVVSEAVDSWGARRGVALALRELAPRLLAASVPPAMRFFVERGLADRNDVVRGEMLNAAMAIVDLHGKETLSSQLPVFENFLDKAPKSGGYDAVRQSVVLLVGSLARHLEPKDARIKPITLRLVAALSTPSQQVQEAVSNCLPHLVGSPALEDEIPAIMNKLMKQLLTAEKYGDRKGAAYGIAGIIKGLGILSLKQLDVMGKLTEAIQEKKNFKYREGALFGFEMLCYKLGRLFEPYIVHVLPHLLLCFGDTSQYVRAAADDTAKLIMSKLSAHGVKLVLPSLLQALQDDNWRTKAGSIELLGAMAYCAPKQLSSCLPSIVPKLIEVLSDSHMRVQEAGAEALGVIGSVIRNPEIQAIVPVLLEALQDPSNRTSACLQTLLDTKFVHFIDAPSLALIMPVVQRAFLDRSTETRKMAAQIIGNMYSLTDQKDLMPYLPNIIPGLKSSLLDPVPEVRSVSARALGAMVKGMGESSFEELLPWLMHTLTSESSSVDRSGAAQGLSEVVAGLGVHKLHKIMPDIIATAERTDIAPHVKDGYIMMFIYMPGAFTDEFLPYIGQIINPILKALADENEYVRETALKAGQRIVNLYAESAITLLLPELERGLFDDNWRIRYSSVQLLGDLLYRISGVSGKMSTETASEDDNFGTEHSHKAIINALGPERRNRVLAGLYMGRSDVALMVRQAALHVWKVVVTNTPKTLREILPTLFGLLLGCLASTSYDKRQVAARTLGDLVRKLGERVLPEIVPILERGLRSDRADQRQGVCIGLGEILASTSRDAVLSFADGLVPTVRTALCDPLPEVRMAAARTFDSLHATIGNKALDDILPQMLDGLKDPDPDIADATLDGLKQIMAIKSRAVLPYLVPVLTGGGGAVDTRALSALAAAAGGALARHLPRVLPALLAALVAVRAQPAAARELDHCRDALLPVVDPPGVRSIIDTLLETIRTTEGEKHCAAASLLCAFVSHTRADLAPHVPQLIRGLLLLFGDQDRDVLLMAWEALGALAKSLDPERQIAHVSDVRQAVRYAAADLKPDELLPGFCLPKGLAPILPLFRESILNGLPEDKENAALMLGEIIKLTSAAAIQPSVVHITGPLIRILGDRFNSSVKAAVLETLATLLTKVGVMLKQFLPQLQTTFLKALNDPNRPVRIKACLALSQLVVIHSRADPLFLEMHNTMKNIEDPLIKETMLQALRGVITAGGDKMTATTALAILPTLTGAGLLAHADDPPRSQAAGCLGAMLHCLPDSHRDAALTHHLLAPSGDEALAHGRSTALFVALKETPAVLYRDEDKVDKALLALLASDKIPIACNGIRAMAYLMRYLLKEGRSIPPTILSAFVRSMNHQSNEVKQLMARAATMLGREAPLSPSGAAAELLHALLPALVNGTKEKNTYVRANAETALRAVLRLPQDEQFHLQCMALLEEGAREALGDVVARVLRRNVADGRDEDLDCTLLT